MKVAFVNLIYNFANILRKNSLKMKKEKITAIPKRKEQPKIYKNTTPPKSAELGNELWQVAHRRVGRPLRFETAADLWNVACEYFAWCVDNPLIEIDYKGKDAKKVEMKHPRPFTMRAFYLYAGVNEAYINDLDEGMKKRLAKGDDEEAKQFSETLAYIRDICFSQKFDNAMAGLYNPMIAKCDLGLSDKSEAIVKTQELPKIIMIDDSGNKIEGIE